MKDEGIITKVFNFVLFFVLTAKNKKFECSIAHIKDTPSKNRNIAILGTGPEPTGFYYLLYHLLTSSHIHSTQILVEWFSFK